MEEWTWGEAVLVWEQRQEDRRRHYQALSLIAAQQAALTAHYLAGGKERPVFQLFPFWTQEEQDQLRLQHYRSIMEGLASPQERK